MDKMLYARFFILLVFLIAINITDVKYNKIKNKVVFPAVIAGLVIGIFSQTLLDSIYGMLIPMVLFPLYLLRMLGAGDIKALCAVGAISGFDVSVITVLASFISGGVIALVIIILSKSFIKRMKYLFSFFKNWFKSGIMGSYNFGGEKNSRFCFSFAITSGTVIAWLYTMFGCPALI